MNGPTSLENAQPSLIIDPEARPDRQALLTQLRDGIQEKPVLYAAVFDIAVLYAQDNVSAGFTAEDTYLRQYPSDSESLPEARDKWTLFLRQLPGSSSETIASDYWFDPATTEAIRKDPDIQKLFNETSNGRTVNSDRKKEIQEEVKLARLRFFLARAVAMHSVKVSTLDLEEGTNKEANGSAAWYT